MAGVEHWPGMMNKALGLMIPSDTQTNKHKIKKKLAFRAASKGKRELKTRASSKKKRVICNSQHAF